MGSSRRSLTLFLVGCVALTLGYVVWGGAGLVAGDTLGIRQTGPLIASSQTPLVQDFFAGGDAEFTVTITNTGSIAFESVTTSNSPTPLCNRNNLGGLNPGQSLTFDCGRNNVSESFMNEILVTGQTGATTVSHTSKAFVKVLKPELRITKTPQIQTVGRGANAFFTVKIFNTSDFMIQILSVDDELINNCDRTPTTVPLYLEAGDSLDYSCSYGNVQTPIASIITVTGTDLLGLQEYTASDAIWVDMVSMQASLEAQPTAIPEPGDLVTYTVSLTNNGNVPVSLKTLTTDQFGNVLNAGNPQIDPATNTCLPKPGLPTLSVNGGSYECSFVAQAEGQPSDHITTLTATGEDAAGVTATATTDATVTITNLPASMSLTLGAEPPFINPPSRVVTFSVRVENTSGADAITITEITDQFLGNLDGRGTCDLPVADIPPGFSYQCAFSATVSGTVGQQISRTITVKAVDDDPEPGTLTESKIITVGITNQPTQYNFMPNISDFTVSRTSCSRPFPLANNQQYYFDPPNTYDSSIPVDQRDQHYFVFELDQGGRVTVELTNFVPRKGQLLVRPHVDGNPPCGAPLDRDPSESLNKVIDLGQIDEGRYYIQLINDGPSNTNTQYGLIVRVR